VPHRDHGGRTAATEQLAAFESELAQPKAKVGGWTLDEAFDAYIRDARRQKRRGGTLVNYIQVKARLGEYGENPITALTSRDLDDLYGKLSETYADSTVAATHGIIHAVLERAVVWQELAENPARAAEPPRVARPKRATLGPQDVWALISAAGQDYVLAIAIFLAAWTGARRGELSGLRWEDVDRDGFGLWISRQWAAGPDGVSQVQDLKAETGSDDEGRRWVWIGQMALDALDRYADRLREDTGRVPEGWLLSYDGGATPIKQNNLGRQVIAHCKRSGYPDITTHDFRRLSASELIAGGADVMAGAARLGHTPKMMVDRYARARRDKAIAAGKSLEERLIAQGLPIGELLAPVTREDALESSLTSRNEEPGT
jgi:integrase